MMRKIFIFITWLAFFTACEKGTDFDYQLATFSADDVDTLMLTANHDILITGGENVLDLDLKVYKEYIMEGYPISVPLLPERIDAGQIKYFYRCGDAVPVEMKTSRFCPDTDFDAELTFYATVFGKMSNEVKVTPRRLIKDIQERTFEVIFHVVEDGTLKKTEFTLEPRHVREKMEKVQAAFRKLVSTAPNAVDTKLNFTLAEKSPEGNKLTYPGWEQIEIPAADLVDYLEEYGEWENIPDFLEAKGLVWDTHQYLNVWIIRSGKISSQLAPKYKKQHAGELEGLRLTEVTPGQPVPAVAYGMMVKYDDFVKQDFALLLGQYLGLLKTQYPYSRYKPAVPDTDFCEDTFMYTREGYFPENIMDASSTSAVVTQDQLKRILFVLENCPERQCWK